MKNLLIALTGLLLISCGEQADMVLTNGNVVTVEPDQPSTEAIAISGDKIIAVGSSAEIAAYIGKNTEVIGLDGNTAIPGLIQDLVKIISLNLLPGSGLCQNDNDDCVDILPHIPIVRGIYRN